jgi:hypothetical protein
MFALQVVQDTARSTGRTEDKAPHGNTVGSVELYDKTEYML